jgi:DNA-directed RNA polymerase subunit RPC12/RpoP
VKASCPKCGSPVEQIDQYCQYCGSKLSFQAQSTENNPRGVGDVGMVKGNLDQSTHYSNTTNIGNQVNYSGPVSINISQGRGEISYSDLFQKGKSALRMGQFDAANRFFQEAFDKEPDQLNIHFYFALASLQGNRPRLMPLSTINKIERSLRIVIQRLPNCAHIYALWALVVEDYFGMNRMHHTPTSDELWAFGKHIDVRYAEEIISIIPANNNLIWKMLNTLVNG